MPEVSRADALQSWRDFATIHPGTGIPPVLLEDDEYGRVFDHDHKRSLELSEAEHAQRKAVGLPNDAHLEWAQGLVELAGLPQDIQQALEEAAYMGLVVGLKAAQLAEEREARDAP